MTVSHPLPEAPGSFPIGDDFRAGVYRTPCSQAELSSKGWKRSQANRTTEWKWASKSGLLWRRRGAPVGLVS